MSYIFYNFEYVFGGSFFPLSCCRDCCHVIGVEDPVPVVDSDILGVPSLEFPVGGSYPHVICSQTRFDVTGCCHRISSRVLGWLLMGMILLILVLP